jgi:hypothetical protein
MKTSLFAAFVMLFLLAQDSAAGGEASSPQTGFFSTTRLATDMLGDRAGTYGELFEPDEEITWQYYVPSAYRPDNAAGLLVYISPTRSGTMPKEWRSVMDERNIIWIGADQSGNRTRVPRRILLSLLAVDLARLDYAVDERRVFLSGFSGGARVASMAAMDHPRIFKGGLFFCGADLWDLASSSDMDIIRGNRYALITGTSDQALESVKRTYRGYRKAGINNTRLMIVRNMGHNTPRRSDFAKAIAFLDQGRSAE